MPPLPDNVVILKCDYNQLTQLPAKLPSSLKVLMCSNNKLTSLPDTLPSTLIYIDISKNKLESLPEMLFRLKLKRFILNGNPIFENSLPSEELRDYFRECHTEIHINELMSYIRVYNMILAMQNANQQLKEIKQELIEKTWHPERFVQWCLDRNEQAEWIT